MSIEKLTTQKIKKAIKADEKKLETLQKGSKEWINLFNAIELGKEMLK